MRAVPPQRHRAQRGRRERHVRHRDPAPPQHAGASPRSRPAGRWRLRPMPAGRAGPAWRLRRRPLQHALADRGRGHRALVSRQLGGDHRGRGPVLHHADLSPIRSTAKRSTSALERTTSSRSPHFCARSTRSRISGAPTPSSRSRSARPLQPRGRCCVWPRPTPPTRSPCSPAAPASSTPMPSTLIRQARAARASGGAGSGQGRSRLPAAPRDRAETRRRVT